MQGNFPLIHFWSFVVFNGFQVSHDNWIVHRLNFFQLIPGVSKSLILDLRDLMALLLNLYSTRCDSLVSSSWTPWYGKRSFLSSTGAKTCTPAIDMWSVGCIFAELITKEPLLPGRTEIDQVSSHVIRVFISSWTKSLLSWEVPTRRSGQGWKNFRMPNESTLFNNSQQSQVAVRWLDDSNQWQCWKRFQHEKCLLIVFVVKVWPKYGWEVEWFSKLGTFNDITTDQPRRKFFFRAFEKIQKGLVFFFRLFCLLVLFWVSDNKVNRPT